MPVRGGGNRTGNRTQGTTGPAPEERGVPGAALFRMSCVRDTGARNAKYRTGRALACRRERD